MAEVFAPPNRPVASLSRRSGLQDGNRSHNGTQEVAPRSVEIEITQFSQEVEKGKRKLNGTNLRHYRERFTGTGHKAMKGPSSERSRGGESTFHGEFVTDENSYQTLLTPPARQQTTAGRLRHSARGDLATTSGVEKTSPGSRTVVGIVVRAGRTTSTESVAKRSSLTGPVASLKCHPGDTSRGKPSGQEGFCAPEQKIYNPRVVQLELYSFTPLTPTENARIFVPKAPRPEQKDGNNLTTNRVESCPYGNQTQAAVVPTKEPRQAGAVYENYTGALD
ncbi:hypothetical protein Bbelb_395980 [Branchiostoma belcheri]|nr:hypothetical protein Bbelb_395980 [Branchiostoma belcheri]